MATVTKRQRKISNDELIAAYSDDEKAFHAWLRSDPVAFCKHALRFTPHRMQVEVLTSPLEQQKSLLPWGRQFGKTEIIKNYLAWRLFATPQFTAYLMSPSGEQSVKFFNRIVEAYESSEISAMRRGKSQGEA